MPARTFTLDDPDDFKRRALGWAVTQGNCCCFDSNSYADPYSAFDFLLAAGVKAEIRAADDSFTQLERFIGRNRWSFGFLTYDLKNELENLESSNPDHLYFPALYFFEPLHLLRLRGHQLEVESPAARDIVDQVLAFEPVIGPHGLSGTVKRRVNRDDYIATVNAIRDHIRRGDIYELNYCQEFYADDATIDPVRLFYDLNKRSPSPFSVFFKENDRFLISATPERFLAKRGTTLISQPIKGTAKRSPDTDTDRQAADKLRNDDKERAENVMIVDLVRNDLTRCAVPGTVRVEELFGIYSFSQVHQMISTVVCEVDPAAPLTELIKPLFPMGSMTGAPKVRAMQLIDRYEISRRGLFSGAAGYFSPEGDFDFNVIIRSMLYNAQNKYLSFSAGSAITYDSEAANEYDECLLKVRAIREVLGEEERSDET